MTPAELKQFERANDILAECATMHYQNSAFVCVRMSAPTYIDGFSLLENISDPLYARVRFFHAGKDAASRFPYFVKSKDPDGSILYTAIASMGFRFPIVIDPQIVYGKVLLSIWSFEKQRYLRQDEYK